MALHRAPVVALPARLSVRQHDELAGFWQQFLSRDFLVCDVRSAVTVSRPDRQHADYCEHPMNNTVPWIRPSCTPV